MEGLIFGILGYVKGIPFLNRRYTKEVPFLSKMEKVKGESIEVSG